jgi:hypothetical protein
MDNQLAPPFKARVACLLEAIRTPPFRQILLERGVFAHYLSLFNKAKINGQCCLDFYSDSPLASNAAYSLYSQTHFPSVDSLGESVG